MGDNVFKLLRKHSKRNGQIISQNQLGRELNTNHIHELESGKRMPSLNQLKAYHTYFNVSYDFLFDGIMPDDDKQIDKITEDPIEVPEWLKDSHTPDEQMMAQLIREITETGKGMVLLSYLAKLIYSDQGDEEQYAMGEDKKLRRSSPDYEQDLHNFSTVIKEYRKIRDSARYGEAKIQISNALEKAAD